MTYTKKDIKKAIIELADDYLCAHNTSVDQIGYETIYAKRQLQIYEVLSDVVVIDNIITVIDPYL
jgi:hypothetical protein